MSYLIEVDVRHDKTDVDSQDMVTEVRDFAIKSGLTYRKTTDGLNKDRPSKIIKTSLPEKFDVARFADALGRLPFVGRCGSEGESLTEIDGIHWQQMQDDDDEYNEGLVEINIRYANSDMTNPQVAKHYEIELAEYHIEFWNKR